MGVRVSVSSVAVTRLVRAPGGPGDRYLRRKTEQVADLARLNAVPHKSMVTTIKATYPRRGVGVVRNEHPAALFVELGTVPHVIRPKPATRRRPNPRLRFIPTGGSDFVFARKVNHPGNKAFRILIRALRDVF